MEKVEVTEEIMEYLVWVIELAAVEIFDGDKSLAYKSLKETGVLDLFSQHYDVTHTLGAQYILNEIREIISVRETVA